MAADAVGGAAPGPPAPSERLSTSAPSTGSSCLPTWPCSLCFFLLFFSLIVVVKTLLLLTLTFFSFFLLVLDRQLAALRSDPPDQHLPLVPAVADERELHGLQRGLRLAAGQVDARLESDQSRRRGVVGGVAELQEEDGLRLLLPEHVKRLLHERGLPLQRHRPLLRRVRLVPGLGCPAGSALLQLRQHRLPLLGGLDDLAEVLEVRGHAVSRGAATSRSAPRPLSALIGFWP